MLELRERVAVADAFGVAESQVELDHFISHILAVLPRLEVPVTFFGGTALARTHVADPAAGARMSEDIDLYSAERGAVAEVLDQRLAEELRMEFPSAAWLHPLSATRGAEAAVLSNGDGASLRIQLLDSAGSHHDFSFWPTEVREVALRYSDTPGTARLRVPTLRSFGAMKTVSWADRRTARDLYDLRCLSRLDALDAECAQLVRQAAGYGVRPDMFLRGPSGWESELGHQRGSLPSAQECLDEVRAAFAAALGWA